MDIYPDNARYQAVDWEHESNYFLPFGKLINKETLLLHPGYPIQGRMGVYIDIFPLAGYGKDDIKSFWKRNVILDQDWYDYYACRDLLDYDIPDPRQKIMHERYKNSFCDSQLVGARHYLPHIKQWCVDKKIYESTIPIPFEGELFDAPVGYEELLRVRYGDYMQIPPQEKQIAHKFYAYLKENL